MTTVAPQPSDTQPSRDGVCPICQHPLGVPLPTEEQWTIMGNNNMFGHLYNDMLPQGVVLGRYLPDSTTDWRIGFTIEPVPRYIHLAWVRRDYALMHSRCFRTKRAEWVRRHQAVCAHDNVRPFHSVCPDCRKRL